MIRSLVIVFASFIFSISSVIAADNRCAMQFRSFLLRQGLRTFEPAKASDLHFVSVGAENSEVLVMIPGLDSAHVTFMNVVPELAKKYHVITYDQRGHSRSKDLGFDYSSQLLANDLKALLEHLGVWNKKVHILGHSMGARTAMRFANLYPDHVQSIVVEDMALHSRVKPRQASEKDFESLLETAKRRKNNFEDVTFKDRETLIKALEPLYGLEEAESLSYRRTETLADGSMRLLFNPWTSILYGYQGNLEDFTWALMTYRGPLLLMQADPEQGTAITRRGVQHILNYAPQTEHKYFEGVGHVLHRKDEEAFLKTLEDFLARQRVDAQSL